MPSEQTLKQSLRSIADAQLVENAPYRKEKSSLIWERLADLNVFVAARRRRTVMSYVDFRNEVETLRFFSRFLDIPETVAPSVSKYYRELLGKHQIEVGVSSDIMKAYNSLIVPYCATKEIVPFVLHALDELEPGFYGIPEPKKTLREQPDRTATLQEIELVLVPGLAFDAKGNRLGRGAGYYDRFLAKLPKSVKTVALAFECQLFESIPVEPHDRKVDYIITEERVRTV